MIEERVAHGGPGYDRGQVRRLRHGRGELQPPAKGATDHPHLAVRPLLRGQPLDRVVAVLFSVFKGPVFTLGRVGPSRVLDGDDIAVL